MSIIFPIDHFFSPNFIFRRFQKMLDVCGEEIVMGSTRFQKEREAWITALFLAGVSKLNKKEYWVGVEEIENTPDTYGVTFRDIGKGNSLDRMNIEVCEYESHSKLGLADHIKRKLEGKQYPGYFILLCYVHHRSGEKVDLESEYQKVIKKKFSLAKIAIIASQQNAKYDHLIVKLYPDRSKIEFNRQDEITRLEGQTDIIKTWKGTKKDPVFLGSKEIGWPECK